MTEILEARVRLLPQAAVFDLRGELNSFGQTALNDAYSGVAAQDVRAIVLNFDGVDYINSAGIAVIVTLLKMVRPANCRLAAYGLSPHYREIFEIMGLVDYIPIAADEPGALAAAAG